MAKGIFNGFAQRVLASAVCAFAFMSGAQAAPTFSTPFLFAAGPSPGTSFLLPKKSGDEWLLQAISTGYLSFVIDIQSLGASLTTAGLYSSDASGGPLLLLSNIPLVEPAKLSLDSFFATAGYYVIILPNTGDTENAEGQGLFSLERQPANVPLPGTVALLGLGLVGIGAARRKQA